MSSVEFTFKGMEVGEFLERDLPSAVGLLHYMPFRGPGHFEMQASLRDGHTAICEATLGVERVEFVVASCPDYGVLQLTRITRKSNSKCCDECESEYFAGSSAMAQLCPECAHRLYDYPACSHVMIDGRCTTCGWNGSRSRFLEHDGNGLK
jgi:hypothetical protein